MLTRGVKVSDAHHGVRHLVVDQRAVRVPHPHPLIVRSERERAVCAHHEVTEVPRQDLSGSDDRAVLCEVPAHVRALLLNVPSGEADPLSLRVAGDERCASLCSRRGDAPERLHEAICGGARGWITHELYVVVHGSGRVGHREESGRLIASGEIPDPRPRRLLHTP